VPQQETFFEQITGNTRVQVLKSYDAAYAREAFTLMDAEALTFLSHSLQAQGADSTDLPSPDDSRFAESLWQEVEDGAREEWNSFSYFIVTENRGAETVPRFVSPDWPTAEAFAKTLL
jgi:hypothetical protein